MTMHCHYIEDILRSWTYLKTAPDRLKQQVAENIQQFASSRFQFSSEEMKIIQESKNFLYQAID